MSRSLSIPPPSLNVLRLSIGTMSRDQCSVDRESETVTYLNLWPKFACSSTIRH